MSIVLSFKKLPLNKNSLKLIRFTICIYLILGNTLVYWWKGKYRKTSNQCTSCDCVKEILQNINMRLNKTYQLNNSWWCEDIGASYLFPNVILINVFLLGQRAYKVMWERKARMSIRALENFNSTISHFLLNYYPQV